LYLGIFNWPNADFYLEGLKNKVKKAYLLTDKKQKALPIEVEYNKKTDHYRLEIELPKVAPDKIVSVVVLEIEGQANVETSICQQEDQSILLPGILGTAGKEGKPAELKFTARGGGADWRDAAISLKWSFTVEKAGTYKVDLVTTETGSHGTPVWQGGQKVKISCAGQEQETTITDERKEDNQRSQYWKLIHSSGGNIKFDQPGTYELSLVPVNFTENKIGFAFKELKLEPVKK
jgi:alpha-L-fucosidase